MNALCLFVYGTLKRGGRHHHLLGTQEFLAEARTVPGYTLFQPSDYPAMVRDAADSRGVTGEIWNVTPECLRQLDALEGTAEGLYERIAISLAPPHADLPVEAYLYLRSCEGYARLGSTWINPPRRR